MNKPMHKTPDTIWLQVDPNGVYPENAYPLVDGATWCVLQLNRTDVQYVRSGGLHEEMLSIIDEMITFGDARFLHIGLGRLGGVPDKQQEGKEVKRLREIRDTLMGVKR